MVLPDTYSRRKRLAQQSQADVYQYDVMSTKLRQQFILLFRRFAEHTDSEAIYSSIVSTIKEEIGLERLANEFTRRDEFNTWFRDEKNLDLLLDAIEMSARIVFYEGRRNYRQNDGLEYSATLNARMLEDGFGYQLEDFKIIRVDSRFIHAEVVVPALHLLSGSQFSAANAEFRQAHKEYVDGNYDDCIHDCCNAFESVLKVILTQKNWPFNQTDTASKLLRVAFENELIPAYMHNEFTGLRTILESGVPTVRNKDGGHGAGINPRNIPAYIASFQLHQTAAAILLLIDASK